MFHLLIYRVAISIFSKFHHAMDVAIVVLYVSSVASSCCNICVLVFQRALANVAISMFQCFIVLWQMLQYLCISVSSRLAKCCMKHLLDVGVGTSYLYMLHATCSNVSVGI
jgi:hypothetical protein